MMEDIKNNVFAGKKKELIDQFDSEKREAISLEKEIEVLQVKYREKMSNLTRLQGAFALLEELEKEGKKAAEEPEKK